jgi:hypothetical protein
MRSEFYRQAASKVREGYIMVLRVGIIGCGNVSWHYAKLFENLNAGTHVKAFQDNKRTSIVAIYDINFEKMQSLKEFHFLDVVICSSMEEFLKLDLDLVSVCVDTINHKSVVTKLITNDIKYIWLEKPAFASRTEYNEIKGIATEGHVRIQVNYQRLFDPVLYQFANLIKAEKVEAIYGIYSLELLRNGVHLLAMISKLIGFDNFQNQKLCICGEKTFIGNTGLEIPLNLVELPIDYHILELKIYMGNYILSFDDKCMNYKLLEILPDANGFKSTYEIKSGSLLPTQKLFNLALENLISDEPLVSPISIDELLLDYYDDNL